ncbi:hypothetical protein U0070_006006 [Myodes glareolus]|uniref:Uncharacterized protein n=1 Tax=Myodes glareolus TaxID=447135 RepID=A0AAW0H824_MYOGA
MDQEMKNGFLLTIILGRFSQGPISDNRTISILHCYGDCDSLVLLMCFVFPFMADVGVDQREPSLPGGIGAELFLRPGHICTLSHHLLTADMPVL